MRIGIFSDVHGNSEALEVVLNALQTDGVDVIYCLGDLVGYGPDPNQCVEMVLEAADSVLMGNHDFAALGSMPMTDFNIFAKQAMEWTRSVLSPQSIERLSGLPFYMTGNGATWVHSSPEDPEAWEYIISMGDAFCSFKSLDTSLCFVGHSHVPGIFTQDENGDVDICETPQMIIDENKRYIINVGSVGQPRDGDNRACCGVLDTEEKLYILNRVPYPIDTVQEKMEKVQLPPFLIDRLSTGI